MSEIKQTETVIIGAGVAGLALSCLMAKNKKDFITLEAHSLPGGCASFFQRDSYMFDVGATTLTGFFQQGPLQTFYQRCGLDHSLLQPVTSGITVSPDGISQLQQTANLQQWISDQANFYTQIHQQHLAQLWIKIDQLNTLAWQAIDQFQYYPPYHLSDYLKLFTEKIFLKLKLAPLLLQSFSHYFAKELKPILAADARYAHLIEELMLIASQNTPEKTPALLGVMSLRYPKDLWYHRGGMGGFSRHIFSHTLKMKGQVKLNEKVLNIRQKNNGFEVITHRHHYHCQKIVSSIPIWNTQKLAPTLFATGYTQKVNKLKAKWGAVTGYYLLNFKDSGPERLYHQLHLKKPLRYCGSRSLFFSLCSVNDQIRGLENPQQRTLTVSTHIDLDEFYQIYPSQKSITDLKKTWDQEMKEAIQQYFQAQLIEVINYGIGDPMTFEKYTSRHQGTVGGIPHELMSFLGQTPGFQTGVKNFYQIGDTTLPGQGVVSVITGALNLYDRVLGKAAKTF